MVAEVIKYVTIAALLACLGLSGALWWQSSTVDRLERNAVVLEEQAAQARLAADVAEASRQRVELMNAEASATIEDIRNLQLGECADAPLDPALSGILNRVR